MNRLGIVIPAYKPDYLAAALESVASQTDREFTLHVCDDASPHDLEAIAGMFSDRIDLRYHRFEENLGGADLVGHWNRCLAFTDAEWVWLFSDDDMMEEGCVAAFREAMDRGLEEDVLRFDLSIVESDGRLRRRCMDYPIKQDVDQFLHGLFTGKLDARMPEFIIRRDKLLAGGGFQAFPLAFRSDNATVLRCGWERGIRTLPGPRVLWRRSPMSLSTCPDPRLEAKKCSANTDFFLWLREHYALQGRAFPLSSLEVWRVLVGCAYPVFRNEGWDAARTELLRYGGKMPLPAVRALMRFWKAMDFAPRTF